MGAKKVTYVGDSELVSLLQMISEVFNELLTGDVLNGSYVSVDKRKVLLFSDEKKGVSMTRQTITPEYLSTYLHGCTFIN